MPASSQRASLSNVAGARTGDETSLLPQSMPVTTPQVTAAGGASPAIDEFTRPARLRHGAGQRRNRDDRICRNSALRSSARVRSPDSAATTVNGRLGEWLNLGAVESNASSTGSLHLGGQAGSTQYSTWVKVDEVP
jgi:hypothetical protein